MPALVVIRNGRAVVEWASSRVTSGSVRYPAHVQSFVARFSDAFRTAAVPFPMELLLAQAALETGWGRSAKAVNQLNLFGRQGKGTAGSALGNGVEWKNGGYVNTSGLPWASYASWVDCIRDQVAYLYRVYPRIRTASTYRRYFEILKEGNYATEPTYVERCLSMIRYLGYDPNGSPGRI